MDNAAKNNFENAWIARHESRRDIWGLSDEVSTKALELLDELGCDYAKNDAVYMYDNLAINGEIIERNDATQEDVKNAIFETENYVVMNW